MYRARLDYGLSTIDMSTATMRKLTGVALVAYPAGAFLSLEADVRELSQSLVGTFLMAGALLTAAALSSTHIYKDIAGKIEPLGEYERSQRQGALARSYKVLSAIVIVALLYGYTAVLFDLWFPREPDDWQVLCMGFGSLIMILPTVVVIWTGEIDNDELAEGE